MEGKPDEEAAAPKVVVLDEEDWLQPPPPKAAFRAPAVEDSTFRELRYISIILSLYLSYLNQNALQGEDDHVFFHQHPSKTWKELQRICFTLNSKICFTQNEFRVLNEICSECLLLLG